MANRSTYDYQAYALRRRAIRRREKTGHAHYGINQGMPFYVKALIGLGILGAIAAVSSAIAGFTIYNTYADNLVAPDELAINEPSYGAKILDRNGQVLYEYVDDKSGLRRPTDMEDISDAFFAATIATEDDSFFTNPGVNVEGLSRAMWENSPFGELGGGSGGSSITQQLVKSVYVD
jgi:membrane peptidoglycan carboxypeptidase